jgi:hypothetical protein
VIFFKKGPALIARERRIHLPFVGALIHGEKYFSPKFAGSLKNQLGGKPGDSILGPWPERFVPE